jgi:hypothetical protein
MKQRETQRQAQRSSKCLGRNLLVAWAVGVLLGGCSATSVTPISQLNASPANFDGKEVMLRGVAKDVTRMPLLNLKSYVLKDDSGEATILTEHELPKMNEEIRVKVKVRNFAIINGESLGTTFVEVERH